MNKMNAVNEGMEGDISLTRRREEDRDCASSDSSIKNHSAYSGLTRRLSYCERVCIPHSTGSTRKDSPNKEIHSVAICAGLGGSLLLGVDEVGKKLATHTDI